MALPLLPLAGAAATGGFLGFGVGSGVSGVGNIVKWGVIGGVAYLVWKRLK